MAKKKLLQDSEGQIWPITTADCVYLADGSKTVKKYIDDELSGKAASGHTHTTFSNSVTLTTNNTYLYGTTKGGSQVALLRLTNNDVVDVGNSTSLTCLLGNKNPTYYNGSTSYTLYHTGNKPTPADIGAAASSHGTHLTLGTGSGNAYYGDKGKIAYDHSQAAHAPSNAQKNSDITKAEIEAKLTGTVTSHNHSGTYAPASHNHTSLTGITSLTFAANSDDSSIIKITKDSAISYTDFIMSDDAGSDMWRWRFKAWDSSASTTTAEYNLMTLKATSTTKGQLSVNGNVTADSFTEGGTALSSKYAAASHGTHVSYGGNGSATTVSRSDHTHSHLEIKGTNTITSTTNDTTAKWGEQKTSIHWYTTTGQLTDQPSQWGYLLNIGKDSEVHQLWMTQASGDLRHRGGNASGWSGTWRTLLDTSNFTTHVTPSAIGAAASSHGTHLTIGTGSGNAAAGNHTHSYLPLGGGTMTGDVYFPNGYGVGLKDTNGSVAWIYVDGNNNLRIGNSNVTANIENDLVVDGCLEVAGDTSTDFLIVDGVGTFNDDIEVEGTVYCSSVSTVYNVYPSTAYGASCGSSTAPWEYVYSQSFQIRDYQSGVSSLAGEFYVNDANSSRNVYLQVGGTATNKYSGTITIYNSGSGGNEITPQKSSTSGRYQNYLPTSTGTFALTSSTSDRTKKDNIVYTTSEECKFSNKDFYNFVRDDLDLATYTLKKEIADHDTNVKLNFIAQDILWDFNKNEENKVGNLIVLTKKAVEEQDTLQYDTNNYISVLAGALKEAINEIEILKAKIVELESKNN